MLLERFPSADAGRTGLDSITVLGIAGLREELLMLLVVGPLNTSGTAGPLVMLSPCAFTALCFTPHFSYTITISIFSTGAVQATREVYVQCMFLTHRVVGCKQPAGHLPSATAESQAELF